jgi:hypothetical protein
LTLLGDANNNHISVLVNNVSTSFDEFSKLEAHEVTQQTNNKIENHTFVTQVIMKDIREKGLK